MSEDQIQYQINKVQKFTPCFEEQAGWFSKMFFLWTHKLIKKGNSKVLDNEDLSDLTSKQDPYLTYNEFTHMFGQSGQTKSFLSVFKRFLGKYVILAGIISTFSNLLQYSGPIAINGILQFLNNPDPQKPFMDGFIYVIILLGCYFLRTIVFQHGMHFVNLACIKCLNLTNSTIYQKVITLSNASRKWLQTGSIMNYINVDGMALYYFLMMCTFLFSAPFMIIAGLFLLVREVGTIGLVCPVIFFVGMFLQQKIFKKAMGLRKDQLFWTDKRSKCVNQYFSGIRIVKYYGWQSLVSQKIENIRKQELSITFRGLMLRTFIEIIMNMLPIIAAIVIFAVYSSSNAEGLTPAKVYSVLSVFNLISLPMRMLVMSFINYINAKTSASRIQHFIAYEDRHSNQQNFNDKNLKKGQIVMKDCIFDWETEASRKHFQEGKKLANKVPGGGPPSDSANNSPPAPGVSKPKKKKSKTPTDPNAPKKKKKKTKKNSLAQPLLGQKQSQKPPQHTLDIGSLHISPGEFIAVVGRVGSGKSTLLYSILGQIHKQKGIVNRNGSIAYIPQISWLRSATIRDNILFEKEYDEERYQKVISLCELRPDLQILGGGDLTEIGEKGVNLSGGQKQRISIARALYADADIYLIDDCLSALDAYVGRSVFENTLRDYLHGRGKTVILVTNAIEYTDQCDRVIVMNRGTIAENDSPYQLMKRQNSLYKNLKSQHQKQIEKNAQIEAEKMKKKQEEQQKLRRQQLLIDDSTLSQKSKEQEKPQKKLMALVKTQERLKGSVPAKFYYRFLTGPGLFTTIQMFLFIILAQVARVLSDWWLGQWSNNVLGLSTNAYIGIYAGFSLVAGLLILIRGLFFAKFIISTSKTIQRKLVYTLLHSPLSWFDVTPTGRIIARTTKDQDDLDNTLSFNLQFATQNLLIMFTSIVTVSVATPLYLIAALITGYVYYRLIGMYLNSSRQIKRLQANTRAPLISHIQETINGIYVIRAFNLIEKFRTRFFVRQKAYIVATVNQNITNRWIGLVTDLFSLVTIGVASVLGVITTVSSTGTNNSNLVGLALSWTLQLNTIMSFTLRILADTQSNMNAVVRLYDYIDNNPQQKSFQEPAPKAVMWPSQGNYSVKEISYRYRPQLPLVIKKISFDIKSCAKIGVAGRTGCGKSTLTLGLLRILELAENQDGSKGQIILDNEQVADLGLHKIRHTITIIPQDPTLFTGTIKSNIDPFGTFSDEQVAESLRKVQLWDQIKEQPGETSAIRKRVYSRVDDSGSNFSLGQKQLICMARALIKKPKVLLMDEATASIDNKTDELIQKMIREQFKETTVITIAHRLNTIVSYDKIIVLQQGQIKEYDSPYKLVSNPNSYLGSMIRRTSQSYADYIVGLAQATAHK